MDYVRRMEPRFPELRYLLKVPNGSGFSGGHKSNAVRVAWLYREGMRKGAPDYTWHKRRGGFYGWAAELKRTSERPKRAGAGGVSADQADWIRELRVDGWAVRVCYGADEAIAFLRWYLGEPANGI